MAAADLKTCLATFSEVAGQSDLYISLSSNGMETMAVINGLYALITALCVDVVGDETAETEALAHQMRDKVLNGTFQVLRPSTPSPALAVMPQ